MRVLGVDPGLRRVGVALSDEDARIALPLCTLEVRSGSNALDALVALAAEHAAELIVIGLPLRLDGGESDGTRRVRRLAHELGARVSARVVLWDERLSSAQAERALREAGSKGRAKKARIDQVAATLILQSYLDSTRRADG
jgi:putative Holliday junction resolvase